MMIVRGEDKDDLMHCVEETYKDIDKADFGEFKSVVCKKGDIRITLPQILHGSTKCNRQRRVIFPCLMEVDNDGALEFAECGKWKSIAHAHLLMTPIKTEPSGQSHRFSLSEEKFKATVEIMGITALGDALVGRRGWNSGAVLKERDVILGSDERLA